MDAGFRLWFFFNLIVLVLLALDLFLHRKERIMSMKEAIFWSLGWIVLALGFNLYIYFTAGWDSALAFFTGYVVEKSLSVDNLFVFLLIFHYFNTPKTLLHKVLFWGVLGAILMRAMFILLGIVILQKFHAMIYVFGAFLIFTGIKFLIHKKKEIHPENNVFLKLLRKIFPVSLDYHGNHFFIKEKKRWVMTPLFVVLVIVETTDIVFAVDSIPVILGITQDPFIVYSSNILAILGLRSLYFVLSHLMQLFVYFHYGLSSILIFIGLKMILSYFIKIPIPMTLGVIAGVLALSIGCSFLFPPRE